jgi:CubicO group peptidase (beta-lactamase class C family)
VGGPEWPPYPNARRASAKSWRASIPSILLIAGTRIAPVPSADKSSLRERTSVHYAVVALLAVVALAGCGGAVGTTPSTRSVSAADARRIDRLFSDYARPGAPGAAVAVVDHGRLAFLRVYGQADLERQTPVTESTNFRLASLTKPFTALAIMLLIRDGRLTLDERASDLLPEFPAYGRDIRIRHLLTHTSGLRAYQDFVPESSTRHVKDRDVLTLLRRTDRLLFPPGTAFRYGDSGYAVLALVVEAVSRQPFAAFMRDRVFAPAGMTSSVVWEPGVSEVRQRALGYARTGSGFRLADHSNTSTVLGDGGIYSSVRDLVAWDRALDERTLLDERLQQRAWMPATLDDGTKLHYGLGWFVEDGADGSRVFHRGDTSGFSHFIVKYPLRKQTLIVLTNRQGGAATDLATTILALPSLRADAR